MKGKRILLLDAGGKVDTGIVDNPSEIHSNRVCAISPGSVEFLKEVGVWQNVARSQHVERMQVRIQIVFAFINIYPNHFKMLNI